MASGIATCPPDQVLSSAVSSTAETAADLGGNTCAPSNLVTVRLDTTAPLVTDSCNAGSYTVDQRAQIACTASDATSGGASSTCLNISGAADSFGLGMPSDSATATHKAGNTDSGWTSFTVSLSPSSLQILSDGFCTDPSVAASLDQDVTDIAQAPNANAKAGAGLGASPMRDRHAWLLDGELGQVAVRTHRRQPR